MSDETHETDPLPNYGLFEAAIVLEDIDGRRCATPGRTIVELLAVDGAGDVLVRVIDDLGDLEAGTVLTVEHAALLSLDDAEARLRRRRSV